MKEIEYKGYYICFNFYKKGEFTVYFDDDDFWFKTKEEAEKFIDGLN